MSKTIRIEYCGLDGSGRTVTEARQAAARKLTALVRDLRSNDPAVIQCGKIAKIVFRDADGWCTKIIADENGIRDGSTTLGYESREAAIKSAISGVVQDAWRIDVPDDEAFALDVCARYMKRDEGQQLARELAHWCGWQRRYAAAKEAGYNDNQAFHIAGGLGHMVESGRIK